jgi:DnaJ-class molecular chaperone
MAEDLYQALGVQRTASKEEIQKSYRKLARKYHPDMNPDDQKSKDRFKRVQEAYDVLSDPDKRAAYDRYGADFEKMRNGGYRPGSAGPGSSFEGVDLEQIFGGGGAGGPQFEGGFADFFEQLMGRGGAAPRGGGHGGPRRQRAPVKGGNIEHSLSIPLKTAVLGGKVEFALNVGGSIEKLSVSIPPGVDDGAKIRLRGKGQLSPTGGEAGDLILKLTVLPNANYRRNGQNLILELPISLAEAALGGKVDVPTANGTISLTIPKGSSSGRRLRVKGQGVKNRDGSQGDLLVDLMIRLPKSMTDEDEAAIQAIADRHQEDVRADLTF